MADFVSRQVRRAAERRAAKPAPDDPEVGTPLTSRRWLGRTKGMPYSRMMLKDVIPGAPGRRAVLYLRHPTRGTMMKRQATTDLMRVFFPNLPPNLHASMLGIF